MDCDSDFPCGASLEDLKASLACRDGLKQVHCLKCKKLILIPLDQEDEQCNACKGSAYANYIREKVP